MAAPAKGLETVECIGVLVRLPLKWHNMIAFQPAGPAASNAAPAVPVKDGLADGPPLGGIEADMVATHNLLEKAPFLLY